MNKKFIMIVLIIVSCIAFAVLAMDCRLKTVFYSDENPHGDTPVRIALITDLHSCTYGGSDQSDLIEAVRAQNPDAILFGGDIFDDNRPWDAAVTALRALGAEYECYYVSGNHEVRTKRLDEIKRVVKECGITVLDSGDGNYVSMEIGAETIGIYGFDDLKAYKNIDEQMEYIKKAKKSSENEYSILLIHHPEHIGRYTELDFDLVLCGHAHGGQWRIPGVFNGVYAPKQGLFPKYAGGFYEVRETTLIVSRGLAKESTMIPRIFNRPELVIIDIE